AKDDYASLENLLKTQKGETSIEQRRAYAAKAFEVVMHYDIAISNYFNPGIQQVLRYGENPHQSAVFHGDLTQLFNQLNGKELSYNNLVDVDAAVQLINEFESNHQSFVFGIIKHTNVCGIAQRASVKESWDAALAGDPESAFGGVLVCNGTIDAATANAINEIFFEVLIAPAYSEEALAILKTKKNRILLELKANSAAIKTPQKALLNGSLEQGADQGNFSKWEEVGGRSTTELEKDNLVFANIICKHLKSNAIALIKNKQLVGKGCGQTSRIDALRHAIDKAKQFNFNLKGAVLASDAFFPFNDCVQIAHEAGMEAFIQPGGSVRDKDSVDYCVQNNLAMVMTGLRHFRH
ncbi:MAG: bifunctional phosphoribosylaminoimidazolecarboxamide formyltransferase/IMP cyclohydrolase PurH, partial [Sediminibacterium sp.]